MNERLYTVEATRDEMLMAAGACEAAGCTVLAGRLIAACNERHHGTVRVELPPADWLATHGALAIVRKYTPERSP